MMLAAVLSCHAADGPEPLDAEFLEYLAACEDKDANWTVVADKKLRKKAAAKPVPEKPPATGQEKPQETKP